MVVGMCLAPRVCEACFVSLLASYCVSLFRFFCASLPAFNALSASRSYVQGQGGRGQGAGGRGQGTRARIIAYVASGAAPLSPNDVRPPTPPSIEPATHAEHTAAGPLPRLPRPSGGVGPLCRAGPLRSRRGICSLYCRRGADSSAPARTSASRSLQMPQRGWTRLMYAMDGANVFIRIVRGWTRPMCARVLTVSLRSRCARRHVLASCPVIRVR